MGTASRTIRAVSRSRALHSLSEPMRAFRLSTLLALALLCTACRPARPPTTPPSPPPTYLCGLSDGANPACQLSLLDVEPDDGPGPLVRQFAAAQRSIRYVPFVLDEPSILRALGEARGRGVEVRVLLEPAPNDTPSLGTRAEAALARLGVEARPASSAFSLTHAKYAVIDDRRALILTHNSSAEDLATRRDMAVADDDPAHVAFVRDLFDADWNRTPLGQIPPGFVVSPENANQQLTGLVDTAARSLDIYAEKLLPSPLLDRIIAAAERGVKVRILAAPLDPKDKVAEQLRPVLRRGQLEIRVLHRPKIHAKLILVDGASVFLGSENVQDAPKEKRRELGVIFREGTIAERLMRLFEGDWSAPNP